MLTALKNAFLEGLALSKMKQESIELFISFFKLIDRHKFAGNIKSAIACFSLCVLEMAEFMKRCERILP
jgi:hypothetical protein